MSRYRLSEADRLWRKEAMHTRGSMCPVMRRAGVAVLFILLAVQVVVGQLQVGPRGFPRRVRSSCRRIASIVLSAG